MENNYFNNIIVNSNHQYNSFLPGRRGITLGKPNIKVETVNKETHSLEEEADDVSTTTQMVKAMYSVSRHLSDPLEGCGEELLGHVKPTHTDTNAEVSKHSTSAENMLQKLHRQQHPQHQDSTSVHTGTHSVYLVHLWESQRI